MLFYFYAQWQNGFIKKMQNLSKKQSKLQAEVSDNPENEKLKLELMKISNQRTSVGKKLGSTYGSTGDRTKEKMKLTFKSSEAQSVIFTKKIKQAYILSCLSKFVMETFFVYLTYLVQTQQSKAYGLEGFMKLFAIISCFDNTNSMFFKKNSYGPRKICLHSCWRLHRRW